MTKLGGKALLKKIKNHTIDIIQTFINPGEVRFTDVWPKIDQIEGFLITGQEEWLFKTARSLSNDARILEIGCFKGRSTVCIAYGCVGTRRHVFTIDTFKGVYLDVEDQKDLKQIFSEGFFDEWRANIDRNGLLEYVTPLVGHSRKIARIWMAPIHMLFIDGSHKFEDVMADFANFYPHVVPHGIIALHDVTPNWEGCYRAWHEHIKYQLKDTGAFSSLSYGRKPS
jgi:predicted O-methyltransferase YrrM